MTNLRSVHGRTRKQKKTETNPRFRGGRLRLVRSLKALTQAEVGEEVATSAATISKFENGKIEPDDLLLAALADVFGVDEAFFETPIRDPFERRECSFRHLQSISKKLLDQVMARASCFQEAIAVLSEFVTLPAMTVRAFRASSGEEIEEAAAMTRQHLGVGADGPISNCIRLVENAGVVVTRLSTTNEKVDAFSRFGRPPLIVLTSAKVSASRDRFNVAHELGHLVIHREVETGDTETESQANRFAAALLLPRRAFVENFRATAMVDWANLFELKRYWRVSVAAILHRANDLGLLRPATYRRLYKHYYWKSWHRGEPFEPKKEQPELFKIALGVAEDSRGIGPSELAEVLGWSAPFFEHVTGVEVPSPPLPANVTSIKTFRERE